MTEELALSWAPGKGALTASVCAISAGAGGECGTPDESLPMSCALPQLDLTVLAVDDDPANLRVFEQIFEAFGARVTTAARGLEALALLETRRFDLALIDVHMPEMSGLELVRRLRARPGPNRDTPAIAVTADVYSYRRADYLRFGFDDYLPKPTPVAALVEAARRLAERGRRPPPTGPIAAGEPGLLRMGAAHGNVTDLRASATARLA